MEATKDGPANGKCVLWLVHASRGGQIAGRKTTKSMCACGLSPTQDSMNTPNRHVINSQTQKQQTKQTK